MTRPSSSSSPDATRSIGSQTDEEQGSVCRGRVAGLADQLWLAVRSGVSSTPCRDSLPPSNTRPPLTTERLQPMNELQRYSLSMGNPRLRHVSLRPHGESGGGQSKIVSGRNSAVNC
jgi:hypothetical protein